MLARRILSVVALALAAWILGATTAQAEFQVNTYTTGDQSEAVVGMDGAGNAVALWRSENNGVVGQRFDNLGTPVGTEFVVSSGSKPAIAVVPDGRFIAAWHKQDPGADHDIFVELYDSLGVPAGTAIRVNSRLANGQTHPMIGAADDGSFVVAWRSFDPTLDSQDVFARRFDSTGSPLGPDFLVNTYTTEAQGNPMALDVAPDGSFVVAWRSRFQLDGLVNQDSGDVFAQRFDPDGATVGTEFLVNTHTPGAQGMGGLDVAVNDDGSFVIVWNGNNFSEPYLPGGEVYGKRYSSTGAVLGGEFQVNTTLKGVAIQPSIANDAAGNFLVAYRADDRDRGGVFARYFGSDGTPMGPDFRVNQEEGGHQDCPGASSDAEGNFFLTWKSECRSANFNKHCEVDQDGDDSGVFAARFGSAPPVCPVMPLSGCEAATQSKIGIKAGKFDWHWKADSLAQGFGEPAAGLTHYVLCVYENESGGMQTHLQAALPAGGESWAGTSARGNFRYRDSEGLPGGLTKVKLKGRVGRKARIKVKGKGGALPPVSLPIGEFTSVTTQLLSANGDCWESEHQAPAAVNTSKRFKALVKQ